MVSMPNGPETEAALCHTVLIEPGVGAVVAIANTVLKGRTSYSPRTEPPRYSG